MPEQLRLIELGPGRGTLMADLLRGTQFLKPFRDALKVHLVEVIPLKSSTWMKNVCPPGAFERNHPDGAALGHHSFNSPCMAYALNALCRKTTSANFRLEGSTGSHLEVDMLVESCCVEPEDRKQPLQ